MRKTFRWALDNFTHNPCKPLYGFLDLAYPPLDRLFRSDEMQKKLISFEVYLAPQSRPPLRAPLCPRIAPKVTGDNHELWLRDQIRAMGYPRTKRVWNSGRGKKPSHDVFVHEIGLKIEAKRRKADMVKFPSTWLKDIGPGFVLELTPGLKPGQVSRSLIISQWLKPVPYWKQWETKILRRYPLRGILRYYAPILHKGRTSMMVIRLRLGTRLHTSMLKHDVLLQHDGKYFLIQPLKDYLDDLRSRSPSIPPTPPDPATAQSASPPDSTPTPRIDAITPPEDPKSAPPEDG
jgi:hypothetical protein